MEAFIHQQGALGITTGIEKLYRTMISLRPRKGNSRQCWLPAMSIQIIHDKKYLHAI